jgi:RNA methyltransferase, TrmH family
VNQNQIKIIGSLSHGKYRKLHGLFIVEGAHVVDELLKSNWDIQTLVFTHEAAESLTIIIETAARRKIPIDTLNQKVFYKLSDTESPQGVLAVVGLPKNDLGMIISHSRILIADGVADPGNLGTMVRTAAAFGFGGFITTPGSADLFAPKTVRATQGAIFHLAVANHIDYEDIERKIKPSHRLYCFSARAKTDLRGIKPATKSALVVGAEIAGVNEKISSIADQILRIPMDGPVESLNAAVAAGIAMYEFSLREP